MSVLCAEAMDIKKVELLLPTHEASGGWLLALSMFIL